MKNLLASCIGFLAVAAVAGCGGDSDSGASCGNTPACGGNIVGTWRITDSCVSASAAMIDECPGATTNSSDLEIAGTVTYRSDLTYTASGTLSGSATVTLPSSCLMAGGFTLTCAQLTEALNGEPTIGTANCVAAGTSCRCTVSFPSTPSNESGTYTTTAAGLLTETDTDQDITLNDYCVSGGTMTLSPHQGSGMMGDMVTGTIKLSKQ